MPTCDSYQRDGTFEPVIYFADYQRFASRCAVVSRETAIPFFHLEKAPTVAANITLMCTCARNTIFMYTKYEVASNKQRTTEIFNQDSRGKNKGKSETTLVSRGAITDQL